MLTFLGHYRCLILEKQFLIINSEPHCDLLENYLNLNQVKALWFAHFWYVIQNDSATLSHAWMCMNCNNKSSHSSCNSTIVNLHLECLLHPVWSPNLAPYDFHSVWTARAIATWDEVQYSKEMKGTVHRWLCSKPKVFFLTNPSMSEAVADLHRTCCGHVENSCFQSNL